MMKLSSGRSLRASLRAWATSASAAPMAGWLLSVLASGRFDLVLADVLMPDIGGVGLLKEAMRVSPSVAVILVTSVIDIEAAVDALKDGAYDYITKPFSPEQISISVARALEKRRLLLENQNYQRTLEEQVASRTRQLEQAWSAPEHVSFHPRGLEQGSRQPRCRFRRPLPPRDHLCKKVG